MTTADEDSELEQRLAYHRHMHKHLQELSLFVLFEAVESNLMPVEDALRAVAVNDAILRSVDTGKREAVEDWHI